jgi:hypothetical protein
MELRLRAGKACYWSNYKASDTVRIIGFGSSRSVFPGFTDLPGFFLAMVHE